ncbi:MAG: autotransporter domain-containing protein [Pseudomonadota bacterium]
MKKYTFFLLLILLCSFSPAISSAAVFSALYVFGDSLSDSGQLPDIFAGHPNLRATNRINPLNPNSETAMVWSQYFSQDLGLGQLLPSDPWFGPSGTNYAVVTYTSEKILSSITDRFLIREPHANAEALYVVWGGGNDLRDIRRFRATGGERTALLSASQQAADTIVTGVEALWRAGGRYILVPNLPNIGDIPESLFLGSGYVAAGNDATRVFNDRLLSRLNDSGINVIQLDVRSLLDEMLNAPTLFGFSNENHRVVAFDGASFTGIPAMEGVNGAGTSLPDPSRYIFYDGIHPTTGAADIISQYYLSILAAPGQISILAEVPLFLGRSYTDAIDDHLTTVQFRPRKGKIIPFIAGGFDQPKIDGTDYVPGYDSRQYGLTAGFSYGVSTDWNVGAAVGHHEGKTDIDSDNGEFDIDARYFSLLTGYRYQKLSLTAIATIASLDFTDITRKVRLGPLLRTEKGETRGDYQALKFSLSIDLFDRNGFTFGPLSSLNYQNIDVHRYEEDGHLSTSMTFCDQHRESLWAKMGLFARHEMDTVLGPLQVAGDVGYEKEVKEGERRLRAGLITLPGSSFELPLSHQEKGFWPVKLAMGIRFAAGWEGALSYHSALGSDTSSDQGVQLSIRAGF